jgi:predicted RNase H-like HicB family nuclease
LPTVSRIQFCDTADYKSALRTLSLALSGRGAPTVLADLPAAELPWMPAGGAGGAGEEQATLTKHVQERYDDAMQQFTYTVTIEPAEEGGYNVFVPALPGCQTQADTYNEAVALARECIEGFLEALGKAGEPIPVEKEPQHSVTIGIQVKVPEAA